MRKSTKQRIAEMSPEKRVAYMAKRAQQCREARQRQCPGGSHWIKDIADARDREVEAPLAELHSINAHRARVAEIAQDRSRPKPARLKALQIRRVLDFKHDQLLERLLA